MAETKKTKAFYNTEIPGDWEVAALGKITEKIGDGLHGTPEYINSSEYFFINGNNLKDGTIYITEGTKCVSEEEYLKYKKDLKFKSILLSINGTIGSLALFKNEKIVLGKSAAYINCKDENVDFLFHYLQSKTVINFFEGELTGSTIRNLSLKSIREIPIPLPPLPEQKAIAQVLSTADAAIQTTEKLIAQKELRKKWLMQQLLSEKRIVKNEKWCKSGIKEVELKDIAKITMGQSPNSEDYNTEENGLPLIQGNADLKDRKQVVRYWTSQSNKECEQGDIIMTVRAPVGAIGIAGHKSSIGRGVCSIKAVKVDYWYLYHLLVYKEEHWKKLEQGSTFNSVGSKDIFHFPLFIVHSLEEQTAIAQVLQAADKEISLLKMKSEKLKEQKKGLMQVLLTGKVRLKINI
jgi:type I restriction enzyme S subunit